MQTPSTFTWLTAVPGREDSIIRLRELPIVIPYPLSRGVQTNLAYFPSPDVPCISIFGLSNSNNRIPPVSGKAGKNHNKLLGVQLDDKHFVYGNIYLLPFRKPVNRALEMLRICYKPCGYRTS